MRGALFAAVVLMVGIPAAAAQMPIHGALDLDVFAPPKAFHPGDEVPIEVTITRRVGLPPAGGELDVDIVVSDVPFVVGGDLVAHFPATTNDVDGMQQITVYVTLTMTEDADNVTDVGFTGHPGQDSLGIITWSDTTPVAAQIMRLPDSEPEPEPAAEPAPKMPALSAPILLLGALAAILLARRR